MDGHPYSRVEMDGMTVESNSASEADLRANFGIVPEPVTPEPAAADEAKLETVAAEAAKAPVVEPVESEGEAKPEAGDTAQQKLDKRTREGRKAAIQQEIDTLTATKYQTRREIEDAQRELQRLRGELTAGARPGQEPRRPSTPAADGSDPEPAVDQFETYEGYVKAQARWEMRQELKARDAQVGQARAAQAMQQRVEVFRGRVAAHGGLSALADLNPALLDLRGAAMLAPGESVTGATAMADSILEAANPVALLRYLHDHPDDVQRVSTLHPIQAMREMGKLEARVEAASLTSGPAPAPTLSAAKPPIKPGGSTPEPVTDDQNEDEPVERYIARMNAADRKAGRR